VTYDARAIHRIHVQAEAVAARPPATVWAERDSGDHPAWGDPAWSSTPLAGPTGCSVGAGQVAVIPAAGALGVRTVWLSRVIAVMPGYSVTVETLTGSLEQVETITFHDAGNGTTRLAIDSYITVATTAANLAGVTARFQALVQAHLDRVAQWEPPV